MMPQYAGMYVTMNPKGDIVMSRVTHEMLESPPAFVIWYDKANSRIGLKPAALATKNAYPARVKKSGARMVRGHRLIATTASTCRTRSASTTPTSTKTAS